MQCMLSADTAIRALAVTPSCRAPDTQSSAGPTWSSTGSESTCAAVQEACKQLRGSLAVAMAGVGGSSAAAAWRSGLSKVHGDPGIFPATVLLSAYGFFDGTQRGEECNGRAPVSHLVITCFLHLPLNAHLPLNEKLPIMHCVMLAECGQHGSFSDGEEHGDISDS